MPPTDTTRDRLLKILRLAQQGVGGERDNAAALLDKLLRKHSMTLADLEAAERQPTRAWFPASDNDESTVLAQVAVSLFGTKRKIWRQSGRHNLAIDVTPSEHAALTIAWDVYRAAFAEARHALVLGFCVKHSLFAPESGVAAEMSPEARARAERALAMAETLPSVDAPGRRLGGGTDPAPT
jgi:hypothetical protein